MRGRRAEPLAADRLRARSEVLGIDDRRLGPPRSVVYPVSRQARGRSDGAQAALITAVAELTLRA